MSDEPAPRWNFEPCIAARGTGVVLDAPTVPVFWARVEGLVGERIPVVQVSYYDQLFYLDDRGGRGWHKLTYGAGSPKFGHANLDVEDFVPIEQDAALALTSWKAPVKDRVYRFRTPVDNPVDPAAPFEYGTALAYVPDDELWWFRLTPATEDDPGLSVSWHSIELAAHVVLEPAGADIISIEEAGARATGNRRSRRAARRGRRS